MSEQPEHLTPIATDRGFSHLPPIPSDYGGEVRVYESNAAKGPYIWLNVTCPSNLNDPRSEPVEAVAHLSLEDAAKLRDQLNLLIDYHYQVRGES